MDNGSLLSNDENGSVSTKLIGQLLKGNVIDVGEVRISRSTLKGPKGPRFLIYLPTTRNYLWETLHKSGYKVRVFIEIPH